MNCTNCGNVLPEGANNCPYCGAGVAQPASQEPVYQAPVQQELPEQYRPLSPWAYWGLSILFTVPIVGLIFLIIFSFNSGNINRRNFARSYWCSILILLAILLVVVLIAAVAGASFAAF